MHAKEEDDSIQLNVLIYPADVSEIKKNHLHSLMNYYQISNMLNKVLLQCIPNIFC